jgi:DNA repair protein RAD7
VEPSAPLTWGDKSSIPAGDGANEEALAHDGPVINDDAALDPAGAVTARTVTAGPSQVGEGTPVDEDGSVGSRRKKIKVGESCHISLAAMSSVTQMLRMTTTLTRSTRPCQGSEESEGHQSTLTTSTLRLLPGRANPLPQFRRRTAQSDRDRSRRSESSWNVENARTSSPWCVHLGTEVGFVADVQTTYTKEHPTTSGTWLCVKCCYALNIDPFAKPKKAAPQKKAVTKDARGKVIHYEERKGVTPLGDLCIHVRRAAAKSTDD